MQRSLSGSISRQHREEKGTDMDLLEKFSAIEVTAANRISEADKDFCERNQTACEMARKFYTEFFMGRRYMRNTYEVLFDAERLPEGEPCRFAVRAVDFFDRKSSPIVSEPIAFRRYI